MLNRKVETFIRQQHLLQSDGRYLVALSGGADSVCLLLVLKQLGYFVEAIHCNFHLRGEESDRDELFCKNLCAEKQIPLHLVHFDTREYAQLHKVSIEMAARQLRYHHFASLCHELGFDGVCVAHHQDDVAETVLMNLIRGTGIKGLSGIKPKIQQRLPVGPKAGIPTNLTVIRPLLCVTRDEIEHFLKEIGQDYVTDSTNLVRASICCSGFFRTMDSPPFISSRSMPISMPPRERNSAPRATSWCSTVAVCSSKKWRRILSMKCVFPRKAPISSMKPPNSA